jgi:3',5'-nucleoside bisphosphate phosphatase
MKIDLHVHTNYSDGLHSPKEVVEQAIKENVEYLAIADHNNISGITESLEAANDKIQIIPAAEITAQVKDQLVHIVGLYLDIKSKPLNNILDNIKKEMIARMKDRLEKINKSLKSEISFEEITSKTKGVPNSAHLALTLVEKGLFKTFKQAIIFILKESEKIKLNFPSSKEVIDTIHQAGGLAVLAHLTAYKSYSRFETPEEQKELVKELKSHGLDALEVYIPSASEKEIEFANNLAKQHNLLISGGSDFHGNSIHPENKLGYLDIEKAKITVLRA